MKAFLFSVLQGVSKLLWGSGLGRVLGVYSVHAFLYNVLFSGKDTIEIQGSKMYVNPEGLPKSYIKTFEAYTVSTAWEELTTDMFKDAVNEGDVVLDLGANLGYFSLLASRLVGENGRVYSFEPEPYNYQLLCKNIEINGYQNISAYQKAVSDTAGKLKLYLDDSDTGAHSLYRPATEGDFIEVETVKLDDFLAGKRTPINVMKMDIEGAEMAAFRGMEEIIRANDNLKVFMEFYVSGIKRTGNSPEEFVHCLLEDYHFSIMAMGDYTRDRKYRKIENVDELLDLCRGDKIANLYLEKT